MSDIDDMIDSLTPCQRHEFALACARRVQHLMRDPRSIAALDTIERWLRGEATDEEMAGARDAARAAAAAERSAARSAADAARFAADASAASWVAEDASWVAERAAADAADAALAAERAWQRAELERMLGEGGGA